LESTARSNEHKPFSPFSDSFVTRFWTTNNFRRPYELPNFDRRNCSWAKRFSPIQRQSMQTVHFDHQIRAFAGAEIVLAEHVTGHCGSSPGSRSGDEFSLRLAPNIAR
jgi:hypothetical protein